MPPPEPVPYRPPAVPPAEEWPFDIHVAPGQLLVIRQVVYRGKVVDFAIQQLTAGDLDGELREVARIDCAHSCVHRHQFNRLGEDLYSDDPTRRMIEEIPVDGGDVVDRNYTEALTVMETEWEDNLRRWRGGR